MASRTYHLRTRSKAGVITQTGHVSDAPSQGDHGEDWFEWGEDPQTVDTIPVVRAPVAVRSYSEALVTSGTSISSKFKKY